MVCNKSWPSALDDADECVGPRAGANLPPRGVIIRIESYYYIGYISKDSLFIILGEGSGSPNWQLFVTQFESLDVKGKVVTDKDGRLEISFYNPYLKTEEIFKGREEGDKLYLKGYRQNTPNQIWLEDVFEYIGTGESEG